MTETIQVPVEPSEEMLRAADSMTYLIMPDAVDPSVEGRLKEFKLAWHMMLAHAPKPTIPADDREEVALAIKHCFDTGKTRFDQITDAAISTLTSLGWKK